MKKNLLLISSLFMILYVEAQTLYVDSSRAVSGAGTSWATALKTLGEALDSAWKNPAITTINVARGTYTPAYYPYNMAIGGIGTQYATGNTKDRTFHIRTGLTVLGGYPSGGGTRAATANPTILSGYGWVYHVVLMDSSSYWTAVGTTTLDGFFIIQGNGDYTGSTTITINFAVTNRTYGGGLYVLNGSNIVTNNIISGNTTNGSGGGIYALSGSISNNTISGNIASNKGGGIYTQGNASFSNNIISGNRTRDGGGIHASGGSFSNNTISGNTSVIGGGGGIYANSGNFSNNTIAGNDASNGTGGGIYASGGSFSNNTISGNTASSGGNGGGICASDGSFSNNTISGNTASNGGGGIDANSGSYSNNILWGNTSIFGNGDWYKRSTVTTTCLNNIFQSAQSYYTTVNHADLGTASGNIFGQNPLFVDSANVAGADGIYRTADDGLRVRAISPAIGAGITGAGIPATDILGASRGSSVTIGAYQDAAPCFNTSSTTAVFICASALPYIHGTHILTAAGTDTIHLVNSVGCDSAAIVVLSVSSSTLYVDSSMSTSGNGSSWVTAYKTLGEALNAAWHFPCVTAINVARGTYPPTYYPYNMATGGTGTQNNTGDTRDRTFHIRTGLTVLGGYPSGGGTRNINLNPTVLSGVGVGGIATDTAYHVVLMDSSRYWTAAGTTTLDGFSINGGNANGTGTITINSNSIVKNSGAGLYVVSGSPIVTQNAISGNTAYNRGGGIYASGVSFSNNTIYGSFSNNTISGNNATYGGGIYTTGGRFSNNTISGNSGATGGGGGIYAIGGSFSSNTISGNSAPTGGGGGGIYASNGSFSNNAISGNSGSFGGGIYADGGSFSNNTISGNSAPSGGGIFTTLGSYSNNILWGNTATTSNPDWYKFGTANTTCLNNIFQSAQTHYTTANSADLGTASGNIFGQNPLFVDSANVAGADGIYRTADDGLRVQAISPAIGAGITGAGIPATDILGASRGSSVTIGAYQYIAPCINTSSTTAVSICASALPYFHGTHILTAAGTDTIHLTNSLGCDSTATLTISLKTTRRDTISASICDGSSYTFHIGSLTAAGTYSDTVRCDSIVTLHLTVHPLPQVSFNWQALVAEGLMIVRSGDTVFDVVCSPSLPFIMDGGTPVGGHYLGHFIVNDSFVRVPHYPIDTVTYVYIDSNSCTSSVRDYFHLFSCLGINEQLASALSIYPDPNTGTFTLRSQDLTGAVYEIRNMLGQLIQQGHISDSQQQIDVSSAASGIYYLHVLHRDSYAVRRFVKE